MKSTKSKQAQPSKARTMKASIASLKDAVDGKPDTSPPTPSATASIKFTVPKTIADLYHHFRGNADRFDAGAMVVAMIYLPAEIKLALRDAAIALNEGTDFRAFKDIGPVIGTHLRYWIDNIGEDKADPPRARDGMTIRVRAGTMPGDIIASEQTYQGKIVECSKHGVFALMATAGNKDGTTWNTGEVVPFRWYDIEVPVEQQLKDDSIQTTPSSAIAAVGGGE